MGSELTWNESCFSIKRSTSEIVEKCCWEVPEPIECQTLLTVKVKTLFLPKWNTPNKRRTMPILVSALHHYTPEFNMDTIWYNAWGFHMKYHVQTISNPHSTPQKTDMEPKHWCLRAGFLFQRNMYSELHFNCISIVEKIPNEFHQNEKYHGRKVLKNKNALSTNHTNPRYIYRATWIWGDFCGRLFWFDPKIPFQGSPNRPWDPRYTCETCNDSRYRCEDETRQHRCAA